jgi:hypothetical protein
MASARAEGAEVFREIFSVDRPARALVMIPAYRVFGENPLYYNLSAYIFRVAGAVALLWVLNQLWPKKRAAAMVMALLFLIYPGFLSQTNGLDYQSHIVGLAAALVSIALTLKAAFSPGRINKISFHIMSVFLGWLYLGQMEWYIGFEFFRWMCVFLFSSRQGGDNLQKIQRAVRWAYPSLAAPGFFLIWRIFFFQSERGATDVDLQFSQVGLYPLQTFYHWAVQVMQDLFDVMVSAWVIPISQLAGYIQKWGGFLAILAVGMAIFVLYKLERRDFPSDSEQSYFEREALLLGLFTAIGGLIPIAMVNRDVLFPAYSRYSLVSSVGVAIFIVALILRLNSASLQKGAVALLLFVSMLTHHANAVKSAQESAVIDAFWWQISWRVPQFEKDTTLVAVYPGVAVEEDYYVWGPASLIYYPEKQNPKNIQPGLFAALLNRDTVGKVLVRERQVYDKRKNIVTYANFRNILILTQASSNSCVHMIDGNQPEYSNHDWDAVRVIGSFSEIDHVLVDETPHTPPEIVFGPEPAHGWCYYYQKADLARQRGEWDQVLEIGGQAFGRGMEPLDLIEWMPFLQAYAKAGNMDRLTELAAIITTDPYISQQSCRIMGSMPDISHAVLKIINDLYCLQK